ncbi:Bug family tripartite tricarboxylate transporter substrate binding protein [Bordetella petrii]|uniref:Bug family tripartite tricarboxylate transporter substrate binding protein n=1 Tax=Bordetella petrii TaxID=94624 RepID=UPI001E4CC2FE|nr:tripartite tricarboxylate transporter substrate binding protein [Bordetella petrii]MCD0502823.1 tripartite tricarboxylate transporter substrate binding protein [Bordetella petrii]
MRRKLFTHLFAAFLAVAAMGARADTYPDRPIRLLVGYSPGGAADIIGRIVGDALSRKLGQSVIVENRPGAGSTLASSLLEQAPADGYTLGLATGTLFGMDQYLYKTKYTPDDFTPLMRLTVSPLVLAVNNDLGVDSVGELIELVKSKPGALNYSSSGIGGSPHMAALIFLHAINGSMTHIPYKGGAPALQGVAAGDVDLSFGTAPSVLPLAEKHMVKMLGVSTVEPSDIAPGVPPIASQGLPGFDFTFWFGLFGPAGLPPAIQEKLTQATIAVLNDPDIRQKLQSTGNTAAPMKSSQEFEAWAQASGDFILKRAQDAKVKME